MYISNLFSLFRLRHGAILAALFATLTFIICLQVLRSVQPLIVYFPDSSLWLSRAVSKENRATFVRKVKEMFDQVSGPVVLICGQNKVETGSKEKEKFVSCKFITVLFYCLLVCG